MSRRWTRRTSEGKSDSSKSKSPGRPLPAPRCPSPHPVHPQPGGGSHVPSFKRPRLVVLAEFGADAVTDVALPGRHEACVGGGQSGETRGQDCGGWEQRGAEQRELAAALAWASASLGSGCSGLAELRGEVRRRPPGAVLRARQWRDTGPGATGDGVKFTDTGCQVCLFLSRS